MAFALVVLGVALIPTAYAMNLFADVNWEGAVKDIIEVRSRVNDPNEENLDIIAETTIDEKTQAKKAISTDYDIPSFSPRENKNKKLIFRPQAQ